ncbi:hypothetical protein [Leptospira noguchii]|uniref:hypothetical protein n=1 Tax=Leptospira noguchii TaxID=28182 RepID=UPI000AEC55EF|nr:hypothetical protein [Leptospira noguchii]UOG62278.1 hypothetical protein MAL07_18535 [Leptospira noguchii]
MSLNSEGIGTKTNNSASHSPNSAKRFLRKRFRSFEVNSASHSPWVVRQVVSQSTMKFASDSPQFSYVELTLLRTN